MGKGGKRQNCDKFTCQADLKAKLYVYGRPNDGLLLGLFSNDLTTKVTVN
jgi:hypothetical protein